MKYLLLIFLMSGYSLQACRNILDEDKPIKTTQTAKPIITYEGEEILGTWGNIKSETFIEFESSVDNEYWEKNILNGTFEYYTGGNWTHTGNFSFKGNKLTLNFTHLKNRSEEREDEFKENYSVKMGVTRSGLRYMKLTNLDNRLYNLHKKNKNVQIEIGPLYYRGSSSSREK